MNSNNITNVEEKDGFISIDIQTKDNDKPQNTWNVVLEKGISFETKTENLALNKGVESSSIVQNANTSQRLPKFAVDGDNETRWASNYERGIPPISKEEADTGWFVVDLGKKTRFDKVKIIWESGLSNDYEIQISNDETTNNWEEKEWITVASVKENTPVSTGRTDDISLHEVSARYVRMKSNIDSRPLMSNGEVDGPLSIYEFEIYRTLDYDKIITEAKNILNLYPSEMTGKQAEYDKLKNAVEASERLIEENPNFTQDELRKVLSEVDNAMSKYKEFIVPVTGIKGSEMTLLAGKEGKLTYEITPENATNKEVFLDNENPEIVSLEKDGTVHALKKGTAKVIVTTKDGEHQAEVLINVKSNTPPTINASDVTIKVGSEFNPLKYASAVDEEDGEIKLTKENIIKNTVDPSKEGKGIVTYRVTDKDGNSVEKTINVTVENSVVVDKTDLNKAIKEARSIETSKYTEESVKAFEDALTKAEAVSKDDKATQEDVDSAEKALTEAIKNLVEKEEPSQPVEADKSGLKDIIDSVKGVDTGNYTEESVKELTEALSKAEGVLADKDATQEEVDKVTKELTEAYKNLEKKEVEEPATGDTGKEEDKKDDEKENSKDEVKTGVASPAGALAATAGLALAGAIVVAKKKREE
ncbi:galactose-binding domain-containing protein [Amedibacterium intestinale]|uniref:galactose-binding domain-containing protein n=1 Tax=Amedibacterium intestinale TaxID=2583452 RepID=UPI000E2020DC